jgi:hypothetical protein
MHIVFFIICLLLIYLIIYILLFNSVNSITNTVSPHQTTNHVIVQSKCDVKSCGALDPVSDPRYNMQQIVKQSILLEEHLTNKSKRCRDCITKHFQHIIGLAEEAQMLATVNCNKYPLLLESVNLYNDLFNLWFKNRNDESKIMEISDKLRIHRKKLIAIYFFDDDYDLNNFSKSSMG